VRLFGRAKAARFSREGRGLVPPSGSAARVWDPRQGQPIGLPLRHRTEVVRVAFAPDGRRVLTVDAVCTARLWDPRTSQPVGPWLDHGQWIHGASFSPDG